MADLVKTLGVRNAKLNRITGGRRFHVADFKGRIEIYEEQKCVPVLGRMTAGMKSIYAAFILSDDIKYCAGTEDVNTAMVFEAEATVIKSDGNGEELLFSGLRLIDNNPVNGEVTFEITDLYLIKDLLTA